ncbi:MAG: glutamine amidotransferase [Kiritimatiellae bacterium]|nr:glutamine amidotransferase [Kiritimatiellia bacterium]
MSYDLVILGDVSAGRLGEAGLEMLKDYCRNGGNLLVLGGPSAYGDGGYQTTALNDILPVRSLKPFDLRAVEKGATVAFSTKIVSADAAGALRPVYLNQVEAKPDARVLMRCGAWPMIVLGKYGEGKTGCITAPPMGETSYCDKPQWQEVLAYVFNELGVNR